MKPTLFFFPLWYFDGCDFPISSVIVLLRWRERTDAALHLDKKKREIEPSWMRKGLVISGCAIARHGITLFSMNSLFFSRKKIFNAISFNRRICKWLGLTFSLHTHFSEIRLIQFEIRNFDARYKKTLRNIRKEKRETCTSLWERNDGCYWIAWQLLMRRIWVNH